MSEVLCPSCGYQSSEGADLVVRVPFPASSACYAAYLGLSAYNIERARVDFLHQEAVDAYAAQHPGPPAKPITLWFALIGLHLAIDQGRTGREVQRAHQRLATQGRTWAILSPPEDLAGTTVASVLDRHDPDDRDTALLAWAEEVWAKWQHLHNAIRTLTLDARLQPVRRSRQDEPDAAEASVPISDRPG